MEFASAGARAAAQVKAALEITLVVRDAIKEAGPEGVVEGHLYAMLQGFGMGMRGFESLCDVLVRSGLVTRSNHKLTWKGGN